MIDIKELRRLAEAATQGEWKSMYTARKSNPSEKDKFYSVSALSPAIPGWCGAQNIDIATICKIYDGTDASNSEFIAAANPSAILSLLGHIEQQEAEIARLRKDADRYSVLRDRLLAADFEWGFDKVPVLVFSWPKEVGVVSNCDLNIDAVIKYQASCSNLPINSIPPNSTELDLASVIPMADSKQSLRTQEHIGDVNEMIKPDTSTQEN